MSVFSDWVERYRPRSLENIFGNSRAVSDLKRWASLWSKGIPKFRAVILSGPSGVGKTASAMALANDMGWSMLEINASDQCTYDEIKNIALRGAYSDTFDEDGKFLRACEKRRKLIVIDEADTLSEKMDRVSINAIVELVKNTKQPVVLIGNDFYALRKKIPIVKSELFQIKFTELDKVVITKVLERICRAESLIVEDGTLEHISENSNGDIRAAIRDLESIAIGKSKIYLEDTRQLSERIIKKDIHALMTCIFRESDAIKSKNLLRNISEEPGFIIRWIDENMPYEYTDAKDLEIGYGMLSRADVYLGRVSKRQYYGMWSYASEMMTVGVCLAKTTDRHLYGSFRFPGRISEHFKDVRAVRTSICAKLSRIMHMSTKKISQDVIPALKIIIQNDPEMKTSILECAALEQKELMFLMGAETDDKISKKIKASKFGEPTRKSGAVVSDMDKTISVKASTEDLKSGIEQKTLF